MRNDFRVRRAYQWGMSAPRHDWYLKQWLKTLGKTQAEIVRELDWNKAKVSLTASGKQPYSRDDINEIADYLHLKPYELLMHPDDAMAIRQMRASAETIATLAHENEPTQPEPNNTPTSLGRVAGERRLAAQASQKRGRATGTNGE